MRSKFDEAKEDGVTTLEVLSKADHFNKWTFDTIYPFCEGEILEIGSGIGNISDYFITRHSTITLSDCSDYYCQLLMEKYKGRKIPVEKIDISRCTFKHDYSHLIGMFDTVIASNVIEHIENDSLAVQNCYRLLKKGGTLVILTPAYRWLYNQFDKELKHFRRYNRKGLALLLEHNDFEVMNLGHFNFLGIPGWYVSGTLQKNKAIPHQQLSFFNKLVPVSKFLDRLFLNRVGLSLVCIGKKSERKMDNKAA